MKAILGISAVTLAMVSGSIATAQTNTQHGMDILAQSGWEQMISLEPCMNGAVSESGLYPSQSAENMSFSTRGVMAGLPPE